MSTEQAGTDEAATGPTSAGRTAVGHMHAEPTASESIRTGSFGVGDEVRRRVRAAIERVVETGAGIPSDDLQRRVREFDKAADAQVDHLRGNPTVDRVFYTASELGDWSLIWQFLAVVRGLRRDGDLAGTARLLTAMGLESALVNGPVKSMFGRRRPPTTRSWARPHRLRQPKTSSFPSGHASSATVFVVVASERDSWWPIYLAVATTVAISRAHVRIHHASDVLGGVAVGLVLGGLFRWWWPADRLLPRGLPKRPAREHEAADG